MKCDQLNSRGRTLHGLARLKLLCYRADLLETTAAQRRSGTSTPCTPHDRLQQ